MDSTLKELCRLLDDRGTEHRYIAKNVEGHEMVAWNASLFDDALVTASALPDVDFDKVRVVLGKRMLTPAQAIDATLGQTVTGETSDGYHTFNELYHHRAVLFSVIVRDHPELAWKSKLHNDGTMYDGMFIIGVETPQGQATYHYDVDPYWEMFGCKELERAPEWDGHTSDDAIARIATLGSEDTYTREDVEGAFVSGYSLGLDMFDSSKTEKGWDQNERNLDEEMEDLGWVRKDAATPDAGTCEADETDLIPFVRADSGDHEVDYIHVMECSACGGTYEHVNGSYEFCPRCRRKVVDE